VIQKSRKREKETEFLGEKAGLVSEKEKSLKQINSFYIENIK